jgi:hypothetical protein
MQKIWSRKYAKMRNIVKIKGNIPYLRMSWGGRQHWINLVPCPFKYIL